MGSNNRVKTYKNFVAAYGFGPYQCFFCRGSVVFEDVNIHHINGDDSCNHPLNLAACHRSCHSTYNNLTLIHQRVAQPG